MIKISQRDEYIEIKTPSPLHGGYGIEVISSKKIFILPKLRQELNSRNWGAFYQGGVNDEKWIYFEFLGDFSNKDFDDLISLVETIAREFNLEIL